MFSKSHFKMFFLVCVLLFCEVHSRELDGCDPIPASLTAPKTGQKAWDKCIEYQERFVYPCEESSQPGGTPQRGDYCTLEPLALNDTDTADNEYNYVVSLGYGSDDDIRWLCGGTIISERHILTAAHCALGYNSYPIHFVYLGAPVQTNNVDQSRLYKIKKIIKNPDYKAPIKYHDIALVETEEIMKLNKYIRPACLHSGEPLNYDEATFISRNFGAGNSTHDLRKLKLSKLSKEECSKEFPIYWHMLQGYVDEWQIYYQYKNDANLTYRSDAGCPLQIKSDKINCMNIVIGVPSTGISTLLTGFTKVVHYIPWIERVVWP